MTRIIYRAIQSRSDERKLDAIKFEVQNRADLSELAKDIYKFIDRRQEVSYLRLANALPCKDLQHLTPELNKLEACGYIIWKSNKNPTKD